MLTPLDIHNKEFKKGFRGYDVDEVDEFLDEVIKDFETLYKENMELKDQLQKHRDHLNRYKEMEETLRNTMVLAQKMADEARRNADKEVDLIIWEAKKKAEQIINSAHEQVIQATAKLEELRSYEKQLYVKLKSFLHTQLELLESEHERTGPVCVTEETKEYREHGFTVEFAGD